MESWDSLICNITQSSQSKCTFDNINCIGLKEGADSATFFVRFLFLIKWLKPVPCSDTLMTSL